MMRRLAAAAKDHVRRDVVATDLADGFLDDLDGVLFNEIDAYRTRDHCLVVEAQGQLCEFIKFVNLGDQRRLFDQQPTAMNGHVDITVGQQIAKTIDLPLNAAAEQALRFFEVVRLYGVVFVERRSADLHILHATQRPCPATLPIGKHFQSITSIRPIDVDLRELPMATRCVRVQQNMGRTVLKPHAGMAKPPRRQTSTAISFGNLLIRPVPTIGPRLRFRREPDQDNDRGNEDSKCQETFHGGACGLNS